MSLSGLLGPSQGHGGKKQLQGIWNGFLGFPGKSGLKRPNWAKKKRGKNRNNIETKENKSWNVNYAL